MEDKVNTKVKDKFLKICLRLKFFNYKEQK